MSITGRKINPRYPRELMITPLSAHPKLPMASVPIPSMLTEMTDPKIR